MAEEMLQRQMTNERWVESNNLAKIIFNEAGVEFVEVVEI